MQSGGMARSVIGAAVLALTLGVCLGDDVLDWGDNDFSIELAQREYTLVMFYAPWCGHCKKLKPEYTEAAKLLKGNDPPITLAKVDCTEAGKETCNKFSVSGYPTLKIFHKDTELSDYNGPRDAAGIAKYMKSKVGPASKELNTVEELKKFLESDDVGVVGYFEKDDSSLSKTFQEVAKKLKEKVRFGHSTAKSVLDKKQKLKNKIVLYRPKNLANKFEDSEVIFEGKDSASEVQKFITENYHGLVGVRTRDNAAEFKNPYVVAYYAVDYVKNAKGTNYWRNRIMKVAKAFNEAEKLYTFAISSKDEFQHELNEFGIDYVKGEKPVVLARDEQNQKFVMDAEFSIENFEKFLNDLKAGKLEPYQKSEPIPEDNSGPVKVAVAKNFDEVVTNNGKDTLVEFYAPWCGHCKKLAPIFDELGEKLADEDVEIVKFDATANDVPKQFEVRGFPTLYWVPKDSKDSPVKYEGGRELYDFVKYISKHATKQLKGFNRDGEAVESAKEEL